MGKRIKIKQNANTNKTLTHVRMHHTHIHALTHARTRADGAHTDANHHSARAALARTQVKPKTKNKKQQITNKKHKTQSLTCVRCAAHEHTQGDGAHTVVK